MSLSKPSSRCSTKRNERVIYSNYQVVALRRLATTSELLLAATSIIMIIILRSVIDSDLPIFFEQQLDPVANEMAAFPARDREAFMAHWEKIRANETGMIRTILYNAQVAGNILSFVMSGHREVGYWLGRDFWGKGIASFALAEFLKQETTRPLYGYVVKHNAGSRRVLEKCGFKLAREEANEFVLVLQ